MRTHFPTGSDLYYLRPAKDDFRSKKSPCERKHGLPAIIWINLGLSLNYLGPELGSLTPRITLLSYGGKMKQFFRWRGNLTVVK